MRFHVNESFCFFAQGILLQKEALSCSFLGKRTKKLPFIWPSQHEFAIAPLHLSGERLMLDPSGAVFWPARNMLILRGFTLWRRGRRRRAAAGLLPPYDSRTTLGPHSNVLLRRYSPAHVLALGDSFHDAEGAARLQHADQARLAGMAQSTGFIWVLGQPRSAATGQSAGTGRRVMVGRASALPARGGGGRNGG